MPTVSRLCAIQRCTATAEVDRSRRQRCRIYSDTALNGQVLCRMHLVERLWAADDPPGGDAGTDRTAAEPTSEHRRLEGLLRDVLGHLRAGVPDPTPGARQVLAVVPTLLVEGIEDTLEGVGR